MDNMKKTCIFLFVIMFFTGVFAFAADDLTKDPQFIFRTTKERIDKLENKIRALENRINTIEKSNKDMEKMIAQIVGDVALLNINVTKLEESSKKTGN
jgi:peptidoglycan hydrolase CwlO-like protein